jgi:hypothetical protein
MGVIANEERKGIRHRAQNYMLGYSYVHSVANRYISLIYLTTIPDAIYIAMKYNRSKGLPLQTSAIWVALFDGWSAGEFVRIAVWLDGDGLEKPNLLRKRRKEELGDEPADDAV